ncbi:MAG TPA: SHOCT domain-containing protein [Dehalococcoidia bacterium]|jgi:hypothetical protein|nr:SHOCT domain-containing protein [Dehalococcoidia bacterium]
MTPPPQYAPPVRFPPNVPPTPPAQASPAGDDPEQALARLADLRAKNLITEEEYQERHRGIIDKL